MLDKFSKNIQGLLYQFLLPPEVIKLERVSKRVSLGSKQDYIWRYLCERYLVRFQKYFGHSWKETFWRNENAQSFMINKYGEQKYSYETCHIRHFKPHLVKFLDASQNIILAADTDGQVAIFLIDEGDLENDQDTLKVETFKTNGVVFLKYMPMQQALYVITVDGYIVISKIEQTAASEFKIVEQKKMDVPMKPECLYGTMMDHNTLFVSNYTLSGEDFNADQTIVLFDVQKEEFVHEQKLNIVSEDPGLLRQVLKGFGPGGQGTFKEERHNVQLAAFNGQDVVFSLYNGNLVQVNTQMSRIELFQKKVNYTLQTPFAPRQIALNIRHCNGVLACYTGTNLYILDYKSLTGTVFRPGLPPSIRTLMDFKAASNTFLFGLGTYQGSLYEEYTVDFKTKKMQVKGVQSLLNHYDRSINDIDMNKVTFARATSEGEVQLFKLDNIYNHMQQQQPPKPIYITASSKTQKTYIAHPSKPGVSMVKVTDCKVIAVLGNLIRVYSFDLAK